MKERSISPTCVKSMIDVVGNGEGLPLFQIVLPLRLGSSATVPAISDCNAVRLVTFYSLPKLKHKGS